MGNKTIKVSEIIRQGNNFLKNSPDSMTGERRGIATMLETALFASENYKGFGYLSDDNMKDSLQGKLAGISVSHDILDDTRRYYYFNFKD